MERRRKRRGVHKVEQVIVAPPPRLSRKEEELRVRGPIITFMGMWTTKRRDDAIRKTRVAAGKRAESPAHRRIHGRLQRLADHFLDTPGHAALRRCAARRSSRHRYCRHRGGRDDGLMPQTLEAISHAKARAAREDHGGDQNKIDLPSAISTG